LFKKWKVTLGELKKLVPLTVGALLFDLTTLPLDDMSRTVSLERFLRTSRLLKMRSTFPEEQITFLELLEKLNSGVYAAATSVTVQGLPVGFAFPAVITGGANPIPISVRRAERFASLHRADEDLSKDNVARRCISGSCDQYRQLQKRY